MLTVPDHFQKSDIHVRRTTISQKQVVFIVPQEFDGDNVKEAHVIRGVQEWLANKYGLQHLSDDALTNFAIFLI